MKWAIYNILFAVVYPFLLPGFLIRMLRRGGYAARMGDRFALYPESVKLALRSPGKAWVWIHAVSVGEVQVAGQLMREWRAVEPDVRFCFSTTSSTGWKMAEREVGERDILIYNPLDFPNFVKSALKTVKPRAIVLTESEIWPNFILKARQYGIQLFLINARVSDRSAPRYRAAKCFFGDVLGSFTRIFAQSELDKSRLVAAGAKEKVTEVTGSFKFDVAHRNEGKERELREWTGQGRILLGGSTWPGEDKVLLEILKELKEVKLVIAPRHFEKADEVENNIKAAGYECVRRSRGESSVSVGANADRAVYLADTTGELMGLYGIADVVFVGKSLCAHGSQNMIEPCLCGKPTLVGPYTENFRPVVSDLKAADAIVEVPDAQALAKEVVGFFNNDEARRALGERASAAVTRRCGVVKRCVAAIMLALAGCHKVEELKAPPVCAAVSNAVESIAATFAPTGDVMRLSVGDMTIGQLYEKVKGVSPRATLWMPGSSEWVIVGAKNGGFVSLSASMDRFAALETNFSLPELFAGYVGTMEEVMPAFAELDWKLRPLAENFVLKEIPELIWLKKDDLDADIVKATLDEIRSMQVVRRIVLEGHIAAATARDREGENKAIDCWSRAAKRNPHDPMIIERVERLDRNAKGFLEVGKILQAMKCFETIVCIQPNNAAAVHNFGICLKRIGKTEMAKQVLKRAEDLQK